MITIVRTADGYQISLDDADYCSLIAQAAHVVGRSSTLRRGALAGLLEEHGKLARGSRPTVETSEPPLVVAGQGDFAHSWARDLIGQGEPKRYGRTHTAELIGAPVGSVLNELA